MRYFFLLSILFTSSLNAFGANHWLSQALDKINVSIPCYILEGEGNTCYPAKITTNMNAEPGDYITFDSDKFESIEFGTEQILPFKFGEIVIVESILWQYWGTSAASLFSIQENFIQDDVDFDLLGRALCSPIKRKKVLQELMVKASYNFDFKTFTIIKDSYSRFKIAYIHNINQQMKDLGFENIKQLNKEIKRLEELVNLTLNAAVYGAFKDNDVQSLILSANKIRETLLTLQKLQGETKLF